MPKKNVSIPNLYIEDTLIEFVEEFKYLGIILDSSLTWKPHLNFISQKIAKTNGIMTRLKKILPPNILKIMYDSLIQPYLQYGILVWGSSSDKLFKLQKRSIRILINAKYNAHTDPIFKAFKLLKIYDILKLQEIKFIFKLENKILPMYFMSSMFIRHTQIHNYATRHSANLVVPPSRHAFVKHSIRFRIPSIFNSLSASIKEKLNTHSYQGFSRYVKNHIIDTYEVDCRILNCYVCQRT
jgi:hypothetical protein